MPSQGSSVVHKISFIESLKPECLKPVLHMFGQQWSGKECVFMVPILAEEKKLCFHPPSFTHHLDLKVHHLLVQRCLRPLNLLNPLEGDKQQSMSLPPVCGCLHPIMHYSVPSILTFSASDKTVLAWMMATCSSFLKFYRRGKNKQTLL